MNEPSLFPDEPAKPEPVMLDARSLGRPWQSLITETQGTIYFENGCLVLTPNQFLDMQKALVRVSLPKGTS
jgi:hypothetical protein